jgi:ABC-type multidrug transport system ATPase subunit/pSer/pThr/pTyr-binding forkhead associated (FHA) protein/ABC-type transport system involved in multi-copper enzyme maturation permease subunit
MIPGFGKEQISLGSAPDNDVVLQGPGVAAHHARLVKQGANLMFIDNGAAPSFANGAPAAPNQPVPFDFRTQFSLGQVQVPLSHPAIVMMIMSRGQANGPPGHILVGREASTSSLVIGSGAVSSTHATVMMDRMMVQDSGSTSGTYVAGSRIPPNAPVPMDPNGVVAFGPIPVPVSLLGQIAQALSGGRAPMGSNPQVSAGGQGPQMTNVAQGGGAAGGGAPGGGSPRKHRTVIGELNLQQLQGGTISIGRTPDNKIVVPHPQVSARHAQIIDQGGSLFLEDLGSGNGTFVRGQRIVRGQRVPVQNGEKVYIGPMPLVIQIAGQQVNVVVEDQQASWAGKPLYEIEAWDLFLEVPDRDDKAKMKTLLDHVSFKALPGDMIALMGPSGAGKTTLLMTLNGYLPPTSGQVRINGEDLYAIYDALRGVIGYVPQDDIVHPELTVFEAVKYSARFRLPNDYSDEEINGRVEQTLKDLGLEAVKNLQIGKPEKKVLSGGQRKRVNIALELVTDPVILFLDEPTSGLAADDTTALINLLHDLTKKTGKTIIMTIHQPAKDEYEKFNLAFIMGYGGIPTYYGPTGTSSYRFFASLIENPNSPYRNHSIAQNRVIDNPRDMFDMLNLRERGVHDQMKQRDPNVPRNTARLEAARQWRGEFMHQANPIFQQMYSGRRAVGTEPAARGVPHRPNVALFSQLLLLMSRYWKVKVRDRAGAAIMFLQAPIIGVMLAFVFAGQQKAVPFWCLGALQELGKKVQSSQGSTDLLSRMLPTSDNTAAMFFVVVSAVWFGTSNSAREIVTERAIYLRERMVNLSLINYVFSKYIILSLVCIFQCTVLLGIVFFTLGFNGGPAAFLMELAVIVSVAMNATALGLLLSTVVTSAEAAMSLTPIALIPQVVLGGLMVPMTTNPMLKPLMYVMPARWGFEGSITHERLAIAKDPAWFINLQNASLNSPPDYVFGGYFQCAVAQLGSETLKGAWGFSAYAQHWLPIAVLLGMTVFMLLVLLVLLKRRDPV